MRSGTLRLVLTSIAALCLFAALPAAQQTWTLAALMAAQAKRGSGTASFREERHLRSMTEPVVLKGTLSYKAPDRLVKSVTFPHVETLVIDGDRMTVRGADGEQRTSGFVSDHPVLEGAIISMRAVLSGNQATLQRHFDARLSGDRQGWTLVLTPRSDQVRRKIASVRVDGKDDSPAKFELRETDGDRIVITISQTK